MVEFVGNWGERPESETVRWRNDVTAAKELCYPKDVVRKIEDESDPYKNGSGCFAMQDTNIYNVCSFERRL